MTQFVDALLGLYADSGQGDYDPQAAEGQGLVEYALILLFIAIAVIVSLMFFASRLAPLYSKIGNSIPN